MTATMTMRLEISAPRFGSSEREKSAFYGRVGPASPHASRNISCGAFADTDAVQCDQLLTGHRAA
jgi:hypothetical protein